MPPDYCHGGIKSYKIAYIYIRFHQNRDEKSNKSAELKAVKHVHADFPLIAEQHQ